MELDKQTLYITDKHFDELPKMGLDDTGEMTVRFRIVGASLHDDENMEENISYTMEYEIASISVKQLTLQESTERARRSQERVKVQTQTQPFPG